jgi:hypothetical protein
VRRTVVAAPSSPPSPPCLFPVVLAVTSFFVFRVIVCQAPTDGFMMRELCCRARHRSSSFVIAETPFASQRAKAMHLLRCYHHRLCLRGPTSHVLTSARYLQECFPHCVC